jgi:hypothetical protein
MSEAGSFRFGWDAPARISTSTVMLQEASEVLPAEFLYTPIPFTPVLDGGSNGTDALLINGYPYWQRTPSRCDLIFYQGDDVVIPLFFNDPSVLGDDMDTDFSWYAQIRRLHYYKSTFVNDFTIDATYHMAAEEIDEYTQVELFLPRMFNTYSGIYHWELYSVSAEDLSRFPKPVDVAVEDWPPPDALRTWLYGECRIVPRTSQTDYLDTGTSLMPPTGPAVPVVVTNGGFVVGPNGRVP